MTIQSFRRLPSLGEGFQLTTSLPLASHLNFRAPASFPSGISGCQGPLYSPSGISSAEVSGGFSGRVPWSPQVQHQQDQALAGACGRSRSGRKVCPPGCPKRFSLEHVAGPARHWTRNSCLAKTILSSCHVARRAARSGPWPCCCWAAPARGSLRVPSLLPRRRTGNALPALPGRSRSRGSSPAIWSGWLR